MTPTTSGAAPYTMLTFAPMIDSETVRLLLAHYGIAYREQDHLITIASLLAKIRSGATVLPLVQGPGTSVASPRALTDWGDARVDERHRLVPADLAEQVAQDWQTFNGGMGGAVAIYAYYHLLPHRSVLLPMFARPVPMLEGWLLHLTYPLMRMLFTAKLKLTPQGAAKAADDMIALFDQTDRRIADGRPYLCGDRLTLGDFALAGTTAPLLMPPGNHSGMPPAGTLPEPVRTRCLELRQHPTAAFVDRLYTAGFARGRATPGRS